MTAATATAPATARAGHRLLGLEVGRFVAALLVAAYHFSLAFHNLRDTNIFDMAFRPGHAGVEYFFVLSGFIIYYIHKRDVGRPDKLWSFAVKRAVRLYPMYFVVFFAMLAAFLLVPSLSGKRDMVLTDLILDAFLLPTNGDLVVMQSWSLRHEVIFYLFFGLAILNARWGVLLLCAWQAACLVIGLLYPDSLDPVIKPFFYLYNIGFGVGIATAWACDRFQPWRPGLIAIAGFVSFTFWMWMEWKIGAYMPEPGLPLGPIASPLLYISSAAVIIFGVTQYEKTKPLPGQRLLGLLGGCSYLLYLSHAAVGSFLIRVFNHGALERTPDWLIFLIMIAGSIAVAIAGHLLVEKPLLSNLRRALLPAKRESYAT